MSKTLLAAVGGAVASTANTTAYTTICGRPQSLETDESTKQIIWRTAGVFSNFFCRLTANGITSNSTLRTRNTAVNGNLVISLTASTTGAFEDTSHTDTVAAGDRFAAQFVPGAATNTVTINGISIIFNATTNCVTKFQSGFSSTPTASTAFFCPLQGGSPFFGTSEANSKFRMRKAGTLKNAATYSRIHTRSTNTTVKSRNNGADGNILVTITANTTGRFEDTTHTDTVGAGEDWNWTITTSTGTGDVYIDILSVEFETTTDNGLAVCGSWTPVSVTDNTARFTGIEGTMEVNATEASVQTKARETFTFSELVCFITQNDVGSASTVDLRVDAASSALTITVTASTTGLFADSTHSVTVTAANAVNYRMSVPSVSGTHTVQTIWIGSSTYLLGLTPVNQTWTHKYKIVGRIAQTYTHKYKIRKLVNQTYTHKYKIRKLIIQTFTHKYKIRKLITRTFTHIYKLRKLITKTLTHKYKIRQLATQLYNITAEDVLTGNGKWRVRYHGARPDNGSDVGRVGLRVPASPTNSFDRVFYEYPYVDTYTGGSTAASLVTTEHAYYTDFDLTLWVRTVDQRKATPNAWECVWIMFRFNTAQGLYFHHYYLSLKTDGTLEFGKKDNATQTEHQYFFSTGVTYSYTLNAWNKVRIRGIGNHFTIWVDDVQKIDMSDDGTHSDWQDPGNPFPAASSYMYSGMIGFYNEDAEVEMGPMTITDITNDPTPVVYDSFTGGVFTQRYKIRQLASQTYTHKYKIRKLITRTFTHIYDIIASLVAVNQTFTHKYKIRQLATQSYTHKYKIRQLINQTFTHKYKIRKLIAQTYTHKYKLRQLITRTFTQKYRIWKLVTRTFSHKYNIIQFVNRVFTQKYKIRQLVNQTYTQKYNIIGRIARTFTQKYNIRTLVNQSYTHKYKIRLLVGRTFTHKYNIIQHVSQTYTHIYNIIETGIVVVNRTFTHKYNIIQHVSTTYTHKYNIAKLVSRTLTHKYNIKQLVSRTLTQKYRIRQLVNNSFTHKYNIRQLVNRTFVHKYNIIQHTARIFTHEYNIRKLASISFTYKYNIKELVGQTFVHKYNIRQLVNQTFTHEYKIRKLVSRVLTYKYNILGQLFAVNQTWTHKYNIQQFVGQVYNHKYNIKQLISKVFTHKYKIVALVDVTNADTSQIITQWLKDSWTENPYSTVEHYLIPPKSKITFGKRFDITAGSHSDVHIHVRSIDENPQFVNTDDTIQENEDIVNIYVEVRYIPSTPDFTSDSPSPPSRMMWHIRSYIDELIRSNPEQLTNMGIDVISHVQQIPDANTFPDVHGQSAIEQLYTIIFTVKVYYALRVGRVA